MKIFLPLIGLFIALGHLAHQGLDAAPRSHTHFEKEVLPSNDAARLISLGYDNVVADYYWLRTISHFGDRRMHAYEYPNLLGLLELVLSLDPKFGTAYFFAGSVLTLSDTNLEHAMRILNKGHEELPNNWRIPYMLGFNYYMYYQDFERAAKLYATAAAHPDAPSILGKLATKLAAEAHKPEIAIVMINNMLANIQDETLRELYLERRDQLMLEQELIAFQKLIHAYRQQTGHSPQMLSDLVSAGIIRQLPREDPLGGQYFLDANGNAATTSEKRRLRLSEQAKEKLK